MRPSSTGGQGAAAQQAGGPGVQVLGASPREAVVEHADRRGWEAPHTAPARDRDTLQGEQQGHWTVPVAAAADNHRPSSASPDRNTVRRETAGHLRTLYTIGAGLSGAVAMERLITDDNDFSEPHLVVVALLLVVAFVATLIPFFHGSMRHMDTAWDEEVAPSGGLMMFDFVFLFVQTLLYFVVADLTRSPTWFTVALFILLATDVLWLSTRRLLQRRSTNRKSNAPITWAWVNLPTIAMLALLLLVNSAGWLNDVSLAVAVTMVAVTRTVVDYKLSSEFYFGKRVQGWDDGTDSRTA